MTRDDAKILWPIIKAWSEGKELQLELSYPSSSCPSWSNIREGEEVHFVYPADCYRIKPEPVECWATYNETTGNVVSVFRETPPPHIYQPYRVIKLREVED